MEVENGSWTLYGVEENDPECIHTVEDAIKYINEIGFLPLFKNDIPGFSLEERTVPYFWWTEDKERDPWEWREIIARSGQAVYGKFFDKKAGFISKKWFPYFANYRRDGYDFDALWDDEKAQLRQKKIMDLFEDDNAEWYSYEVKQKAGFDKGGEKNFEGTVAALQMMTYLCMSDFRQRKNKAGEGYGMDVAVYSKPERLWGYDYVTSAYAESPMDSGKRIAMHMIENYPIATAEQIKKVIGVKVGETPKKIKTEKKVDYPANILKALDLELKSLNKDQSFGLSYAIGLLKENYQELLQLHFEKGYTYELIGQRLGLTGSKCSQICRRAIAQLKKPDMLSWITEGVEGNVKRLKKAGKLK